MAVQTSFEGIAADGLVRYDGFNVHAEQAFQLIDRLRGDAPSGRAPQQPERQEE